MNKDTNNSKIILLLGVSGVGKSTVLDYFNNALSFDTAPKYTTRKRRDDPSEDECFIFCNSVDEFPDSTLSFLSYGDYFGIQLDQIDNSVKRGNNHVLIIGDPGIANQLRRIYGDLVIVILVYCEYNKLKERFEVMASLERKERWKTVEKEILETYQWLEVVDYILDCSLPFEITRQKIDLLVKDFESNDSSGSHLVIAKY